MIQFVKGRLRNEVSVRHRPRRVESGPLELGPMGSGQPMWCWNSDRVGYARLSVDGKKTVVRL